MLGTGFSFFSWVFLVVSSMVDFGFSTIVFLTCLFYMLNSTTEQLDDLVLSYYPLLFMNACYQNENSGKM